MTTMGQISANRRNAKLSTGPKSAAGKRRSSQNAVTHGLLSQQILLEGEDPDVFANVWDQLLSELRPEGELETYLAGRIIASVWRMNRVARIEADLFNKPELPRLGGPKNIGEIFRLECREGSDSFLKLIRYETTIDRVFHRSLRTLRSLQAARKKDEAEPGRNRREIAEDLPDYETNPMAENPADYETNPIERQAIPSADFPPAGEAAPGEGSRTDREQARYEGDHQGGEVEE